LRRPEKGSGLAEVSVVTSARADVLESPLFPRLRTRLRDVCRPAGA
jgi:hypothetical protein